MKFVAAALIAFLCSIGYSQETKSAAIPSIENAKVFAFGGIGYAGITSQGEKDFRVLVSQPANVAISDFELIYVSGNSEAKSYALAGIRQLDPKHFKEMLLSLKNSTENVETMEGCVIEQRRHLSMIR